MAEILAGKPSDTRTEAFLVVRWGAHIPRVVFSAGRDAGHVQRETSTRGGPCPSPARSSERTSEHTSGGAIRQDFPFVEGSWCQGPRGGSKRERGAPDAP